MGIDVKTKESKSEPKFVNKAAAVKPPKLIAEKILFFPRIAKQSHKVVRREMITASMYLSKM